MAPDIVDTAQNGALIKTPWSLNVTISRIICTSHTPTFTFYGVLSRNPDRLLDSYQNSAELLWIYHNGVTLTVWQEICQRPFAAEGMIDYEVDDIIGHFEFENGRLFYAIKWSGRDCPTWEPEDCLVAHDALLLRYWISILHQDPPHLPISM